MTAPLHSRLSPSKASIWAVCTSSIKYIEDNEHLLPPDVSSEAADEGTRAHAAAAALLENPNATPTFDDDEMAGYVGDFVDFVRDHISPDDKVMIEQRVPLFYLESQRGTLDVGIISADKKRIQIIDLKYGVGTPVYAKDNKQLAIYAESLIAGLETVDSIPPDALVTLFIYQPRDRSDAQAVRIWAISRKQLAEFVEHITEAATIIQTNGKTRFLAGDHCDKGFCRARGICKHYANRGLEALPEDVSVELVDTERQTQVEALPDPGSLTREQRIRIIKARKPLEKWLEAVEDQEVAELLAGAPRMGLKLVEGKTNRAWKDEAAAEQLLRNHLAADVVRPPGSIVSVAQAEKLLKKIELSTKFQNRMNELVSKPPGKPAIVDESDKRPALQTNPTEGLEDMTGADCI